MRRKKRKQSTELNVDLVRKLPSEILLHILYEFYIFEIKNFGDKDVTSDIIMFHTYGYFPKDGRNRIVYLIFKNWKWTHVSFWFDEQSFLPHNLISIIYPPYWFLKPKMVEQLKSIKLHSRHQLFEMLTYQNLNKTSERFISLKNLIITKYTGTTDDKNFLTTHLFNKSLHPNFYSNIKFFKFKLVTLQKDSDILTFILEHFKKLEVIFLINYNNDIILNSISLRKFKFLDKFIRHTIPNPLITIDNVPNLEKLILHAISQHYLKLKFLQSPKLKVLDLKYCQILTPLFLTSLNFIMFKLEYIKGEKVEVKDCNIENLILKNIQLKIIFTNCVIEKQDIDETSMEYILIK